MENKRSKLKKKIETRNNNEKQVRSNDAWDNATLEEKQAYIKANNGNENLARRAYNINHSTTPVSTDSQPFGNPQAYEQISGVPPREKELPEETNFDINNLPEVDQPFSAGLNPVSEKGQSPSTEELPQIPSTDNTNNDINGNNNNTAILNETQIRDDNNDKRAKMQKKIEIRNSDAIDRANSNYEQAAKSYEDAKQIYEQNSTEENKKKMESAQAIMNSAKNNISKTENMVKAENSEWLKSRKSKYKYPQTLIASQDNPTEMKYINFKQDYVVLIRKKPFYASTAQQRYATADVYEDGNQVQVKGETLKDHQGRDILPEDNYLRVYQINNFMNISINTTVNAPGTCSVSMKGAERVICAENNQQAEFGFYSWSDLAGSWININESGLANDGTGINYTAGSGLGNETIQRENAQREQEGQNLDKNSSNRKQGYSGMKRKTGQSWKEATSIWNGVEQGLFEEGQVFRNLFKTREAKYGWRFAEKCDWEPMDEIYIFGKSHTLRVNDAELDDNNRDELTGMLLGYTHDVYSMFKMEPLFFGYIETINKTYDASRGCMITVNAKDHLMLLELSQVCTNMGSLISHNVPAINWNTDKYGLAYFENPASPGEVLPDGTAVRGISAQDYQNKVYEDLRAKASHFQHFFKNIMSGLYIDEIVQLQASAAGIPDKYLTQRIEPMHAIAPFWQSALNDNMDFFNGQTESRYAFCQKACQLLMLEFFADEEGHIVVKVPNWVLSANYLQMNNCNIRYYDDIRFTDLPSFYRDEQGDLYPQQSKEEEKEENDDSSGGIGGFINKLFDSILGALQDLFGLSSSGKEGKESLDNPINHVNTARIQRFPDYYKKYVEKQTIREQYLAGKQSAKAEALQDDFISKFPTLFSTEIKCNSSDDNEENLEIIDYSYANITDNVIKDVLDENNDNVIQIDEYRIKVKIDNIHNKYGSLYSLAKYYYGSEYKWHLIAEINDIFEPTEIKEGQWLILYFNEPISDYIINSSDVNNINTEIRELKFKKEKQLKELGLSLQRQNNNNEIIVNNLPFIKGEFISYPRSLRKKYTKVIKEKKHHQTQFFISKNKKINIDKKLIYSNEDTLDSLSRQLGSISNKYILSDYKYEPSSDSGEESGKITLTMMPQLKSTTEGYILSNYKYNNETNQHEIILTIEGTDNDDDVISNNYVLSDYTYKRDSTTGQLQVILTVKMKSSTSSKVSSPVIQQDGARPISLPEQKEIGDIPKKHELPSDLIFDDVQDSIIRLYDQDARPLHGADGHPVYYNNDLLFENDKLISYIDSRKIYNADGQNIADLGGIAVYDRYGRRVGGKYKETWKPPFIGKLEDVSKKRARRAQQLSDAIDGYKNKQELAVDYTEEEQGDLEKKVVNDARFRSQRTDQDIPVIPNEYVISFTLTDSSQEVYNYIEVAGAESFELMAGNRGTAGSIYRCIPDKDHIMQFGLRQHPIVNTSPLVAKNEEAAILGAFLLYKSQLNRYSGVLTCVEDSAIKVGNPIRMYLYDEHPYPLARKFGSLQPDDATVPTGSYYFDPGYYKEQAVFYVDSISRNIDVQGVSTMTLQLKNGRVMGMTNACDILSLFYDSYYAWYQSRNYYYKKGNNTATVNVHTLDKSKEIQPHLNARIQAKTRWRPDAEALEQAKQRDREKAESVGDTYIDSGEGSTDISNSEGD